MTLQPRAERFEGFCDGEHGVLETILEDVEFLALRGSYFQAANRFGELRRQLEHHIQHEEQILLTLADAPEGAIAKMLGDHRCLETLMHAVAAAISRWDRAQFVEDVKYLRATLTAHHREEVARLQPLGG